MLLTDQTNAVVNSGPDFVLFANETNPLGWNLTFCFKCEVSPTGGLPSFTFSRDSITFVALPLDCSKSLLNVTEFENPEVV